MDKINTNEDTADTKGLDEDFELDQILEIVVEKLEAGEEIQNLIELFAKKHLNSNKSTPEEDKDKLKNLSANQNKLLKIISKFKKDLSKKQSSTDKTKDKDTSKNPASERLKEFIIYEIYKAMNPRRIAGETAKVNFAHNVILRGDKQAKKYTGGNKNYSQTELDKINRSSKLFRTRSGGISI